MVDFLFNSLIYALQLQAIEGDGNKLKQMVPMHVFVSFYQFYPIKSHKIKLWTFQNRVSFLVPTST